MNNPIRHLAGPYEDGVQQCTRCLRIIFENSLTDAMAKEFGAMPFKGITEGPVVLGLNGQWLDSDDHAEDCVPMGEGL